MSEACASGGIHRDWRDAERGARPGRPITQASSSIDLSMEPIFETPEFAAMAGFPAMYCRVAASCRDGDDAYVVLDTGDGRTSTA